MFSEVLFLRWVEITCDLRASSPQQLRVNFSWHLSQAFDGFDQSFYFRPFEPCRDANGAGGLGKEPPLTRPEVYDAPSGALFWVLRNGSLWRGMPSFTHLPEPQRWQIVAWLRTPFWHRSSAALTSRPSFHNRPVSN